MYMTPVSAQLNLESKFDHKFQCVTVCPALRTNVTIGHLWKALTKMERNDVKLALKEQIIKDCLASRHFLKAMDALCLYGNEDEKFAEYMVDRMEKMGLKIFFPPRDLRAGMIEDAILDIIAKHCKKVVAIITPSFCSNNQILPDVDSSINDYIKQRKLLPVMYTREIFDMSASLERSLERLYILKYRPKRNEICPLINFWQQLIKSFEDPNLERGLTEELKKMDFPSPPPRSEATLSEAQIHPFIDLSRVLVNHNGIS